MTTPARAFDLLQQSRSGSPGNLGGSERSAELLAFADVGDRDVYNITAPFTIAGEHVIAGRVEARDTEASQVTFFLCSLDNVWRPHPKAPTLPRLQDPCVTRIGSEFVIGGVEFPVELPGGRQGWRMAFYRGESLDQMQLFLRGPDHMKDIRLAELPQGGIAVCSRPQGDLEGRGTIGFTTVDNLDALTASVIDSAPLLKGQFLPREWGGANELHPLANGQLGVLGHIAWMAGDGTPAEEKHYYPMVFELDPQTQQHTPPRVIGSRQDYPQAPVKRRGLEDVIFSGGLHRNKDGTAWLYAGLSDAAAGRALITDPFQVRFVESSPKTQF